jgi:hypothetical protein
MRLIRDAGVFCEREYPEEPAVPPAAARKRLFERMGRYGIRQAIALLNDGQPASELGKALLSASNVDALRKIVTAHFGSRAFLIKVRSAFGAVRQCAFRLGQQQTGPAGGAARRIAARIDQIEVDELRFREFFLLESYYGGQLVLADDNVRQLFEVTGENGPSCAERLGAQKDAPLASLLVIAKQREHYWREKMYDTFETLDIRDAARTLAESFGEIRARLVDAAEHRRAADELLAYEL